MAMKKVHAGGWQPAAPVRASMGEVQRTNSHGAFFFPCLLGPLGDCVSLAFFFEFFPFLAGICVTFSPISFRSNQG
jgi:hypothetical protein